MRGGEADEEADDESQLSDEDKIETRNSARRSSGDNKKDKETTCNSTSPMRRSTRRRGSADFGIQRERHPSVTDDEQKTEHCVEDTPIGSSRRRDKKNDTDNENEEHNKWVRRSSRQRKTSFSSNVQEIDACLSDETHQSAENGVRRSKRAHHKPSFYDPVAYEKHQSTSEDEEEEEEGEEEEEEEEEEGKLHKY